MISNVLTPFLLLLVLFANACTPKAGTTAGAIADLTPKTVQIVNSTSGSETPVVISVGEGLFPTDNITLNFAFKDPVGKDPLRYEMSITNSTGGFVNKVFADIEICFHPAVSKKINNNETFTDIEVDVFQASQQITSYTNIYTKTIGALTYGCFKTRETNVSFEVKSAIEIKNTGTIELTGTPAKTVAQDVLYSFKPVVTGNDNALTLTFSVVNKPSWITLDSRSGEISGTPLWSDVGDFKGIKLCVKATSNDFCMVAFDLTVTNVNDAPTLTGSPALTAFVGSTYIFSPSGVDHDSDALVYSITNKPSWASFDATTGILSGKPVLTDIGIYYDISIDVTDGHVVTALAKFDLEVIFDASNNAPTLSGTPTPKIYFGNEYSFTPSASDPDGDNITFSMLNKPSWATFDVSIGRLYGTPDASHIGTHAGIILSVDDGRGGITVLVFSILVRGGTLADPDISPFGSSSSSTTLPLVDIAEKYDSSSLKITLSHPAEGVSLYYTIDGLTPSYHSTSILYTEPFIISGADTTQTLSIIAVKDGYDSSNVLTRFYSLGNHQAVSISGTPETQVVAGVPYSFTPTVSNPENDNLEFSIAGDLPGGWVFDTSDGTLSIDDVDIILDNDSNYSESLNTFPNIVISVIAYQNSSNQDIVTQTQELAPFTLVAYPYFDGSDDNAPGAQLQLVATPAGGGSNSQKTYFRDTQVTLSSAPGADIYWTMSNDNSQYTSAETAGQTIDFYATIDDQGVIDTNSGSLYVESEVHNASITAYAEKTGYKSANLVQNYSFNGNLRGTIELAGLAEFPHPTVNPIVGGAIFCLNEDPGAQCTILDCLAGDINSNDISDHFQASALTVKGAAIGSIIKDTDACFHFAVKPAGSRLIDIGFTTVSNNSISPTLDTNPQTFEYVENIYHGEGGRQYDLMYSFDPSQLDGGRFVGRIEKNSDPYSPVLPDGGNGVYSSIQQSNYYKNPLYDVNSLLYDSSFSSNAIETRSVYYYGYTYEQEDTDEYSNTYGQIFTYGAEDFFQGDGVTSPYRFGFYVQEENVGSSNEQRTVWDTTYLYAYASDGDREPTDELTVTMWVKGSVQDRYEPLISSGWENYSAANLYNFDEWNWFGYFNVSKLPGNKVWFGVVNDSGEQANLIVDYNISDDRWHHIAAVYNSHLPSNQMKLYIDGNLQSKTLDLTGPIHNYLAEDQEGENSYGYYQLGTTDYEEDGFSGDMGTLQIYRTALTSNEVINHCNAQKDRFTLSDSDYKNQKFAYNNCGSIAPYPAMSPDPVFYVTDSDFITLTATAPSTADYSNDDISIYYTTNGSIPTRDSILYVPGEPIDVPENLSTSATTFVITAIAFVNDYPEITPSQVNRTTYSVVGSGGPTSAAPDPDYSTYFGKPDYYYQFEPLATASRDYNNYSASYSVSLGGPQIGNHLFNLGYKEVDTGEIDEFSNTIYEYTTFFEAFDWGDGRLKHIFNGDDLDINGVSYDIVAPTKMLFTPDNNIAVVLGADFDLNMGEVLTVLDMSNPLSPVKLYSINLGVYDVDGLVESAAATGFALDSSTIYVSSEATGTILVYNLEDGSTNQDLQDSLNANDVRGNDLSGSVILDMALNTNNGDLYVASFGPYSNLTIFRFNLNGGTLVNSFTAASLYFWGGQQSYSNNGKVSLAFDQYDNLYCSYDQTGEQYTGELMVFDANGSFKWSYAKPEMFSVHVSPTGAQINIGFFDNYNTRSPSVHVIRQKASTVLPADFVFDPCANGC